MVIMTEEEIRQNPDKVNWMLISGYQKLSEDFIRKFQDKISWMNISIYQKLSEAFIREFKDKVSWGYISIHQKLSEPFIREFKDKVNWRYISAYQYLSEDFIREFKDKVDWASISMNQKLSEAFIREFKDKVDWYYISVFQKLSKSFIKEFHDKVDKEIQLRKHHDNRTIDQKRKEMKAYAKKYNLKLKNDTLYAFRNHDQWGRGNFNKTICYEPGKYYRDWHCDLDKTEEASFGLGIWPKGNTPVTVKVEDWGVAVNKNDGKARVWGFTVSR
jgi:phosphoribosylanthranilate isomerase